VGDHAGILGAVVFVGFYFKKRSNSTMINVMGVGVLMTCVQGVLKPNSHIRDLRDKVSMSGDRKSVEKAVELELI
jgi:hypothetical protein